MGEYTELLRRTRAGEEAAVVVPSPRDLPTYFTRAEIARLAGVTLEAVRLWVLAGKLAPAARTREGTLLYDGATVTPFVAAWCRKNAWRRRLSVHASRSPGRSAS